MENLGYFFLVLVAAGWFIAIIAGMISAFPYGLLGFIPILGLGFLIAKVIKDRLKKSEDDYYSNNVDK